jgi:hypothetical protein
MKNLEKKIDGLIIGSLFPLSLGLLAVTIWFLLDKSESRPIIYVAVGLLLGAVIDLKFLKGWIDRRYNLPLWTVAAIYIVYNVFVYGFFMGLPVFNVFLGLLAGYYFGHRICFNQVEPEKHSKLVNQVSQFTGLIMTLVCISSGFLALFDYGAAGMIRDVLGLDFEVTHAMMWGIVLIGGMLLILTTILLTRITMVKVIRSHTH